MTSVPQRDNVMAMIAAAVLAGARHQIGATTVKHSLVSL